MIPESAVRFITAGLIVVALPVIASHFGERVAGVILLFPALSLIGFSTQVADRGDAALAPLSLGALTALPAVLVFLGVVYLLSRQGAPASVTLIAALLAWVATTAALICTTN